MSARRLLAGTTRILAVGLLIAGPLVARPAAQAGGLGVDWTKFGEETMKAAPPGIRSGSETDKARYIAGKVADKYKSLGVVPNTSLVGRVAARIKYGDLKVGTCGNLTDALQSALEGGGFRADHLVKIVADKSKAMAAADAWTGRDIANVNHGALGVAIGGQVWVIDAWHHGLDSMTFGGFAKSPYSLMPLPAWGAQMTREGYARFSREDGSPNPTSYGSVSTLATAIENKIPAGSALASAPEPSPAPAPARRARPARTDGATPAVSGAAGREAAPQQGLVLWPKLAGSTWSGQGIVEESTEDGSAEYVLQLTIKVDSNNTISGTFEFPMAHTNQGPLRRQLPCRGRYDLTTGQITLTFEQSLTVNDVGQALPVATIITVEGTMKGGVDPDPNHSDLAQGEITGSRVAKASVEGGPAKVATSRLKGSWRLSRVN